MSKMGQELEKRLDENKYELYAALTQLLWALENRGSGTVEHAIAYAKYSIIAKIEGK